MKREFFVFDTKKGQSSVGAWEKTGRYALLAFAFLIIFYIIVKVVIQRIKAIYF